MAEIISVSIMKDLRDETDKLRGDVPRSKFISRLLEEAIQKHTKRNQLPATGQSLQKPGQSVGKKSIYGGPTDV